VQNPPGERFLSACYTTSTEPLRRRGLALALCCSAKAPDIHLILRLLTVNGNIDLGSAGGSKKGHRYWKGRFGNLWLHSIKQGHLHPASRPAGAPGSRHWGA
jgi:hypothetical protein